MSYWTSPAGSWTTGTTWSGGGYTVNSTKGTLSLGTPGNYTNMNVWGDSDYLHAETAWLAGKDAAQKQGGGVWNNWQADYAKIKTGADAARANASAADALSRQESLMQSQVDSYMKMIQQMAKAQEVQHIQPIQNVDAAVSGARDDAERRRKAAFSQNDFFADSRYLGAGY